MENLSNNDVRINNGEVQEFALLVATSDKIAVTSSLDDVYEVMGGLLRTPNCEVTVMSGEKKQLLDYAHKVLCVDNVLAMENQQFQYPEVPQANVLYERNNGGSERRALPEVFRRIR